MPRQKEVKVKIKKLYKDSKLPEYGKKGDAGLDLYAHSMSDDSQLYLEFGTGIAVKIPFGHVGYVFPRSSISKTPLVLANAVAVIDSNYTGEIKLRFKASAFTINHAVNKGIDIEDKFYKVGDRIGQLIVMPYPKVVFEEVEKLPETNRGDQGFGSSGK